MKKKIISALLCVAMVATVEGGKSSDSKSTDPASSSDSSSLVMPVSGNSNKLKR